MICFIDLQGIKFPFQSPETSKNHEISTEDKDLHSNYDIPGDNRNFELLSSDKASTSTYEAPDSNMNDENPTTNWGKIYHSQMKFIINHTVTTENKSKYSIAYFSKYNKRIS